MDTIYQRAVAAWGDNAQFAMAIEECAELIVAINKFWRNKGTMGQIAEEVADVEIMCAQLRVILDDKGLVDHIKKSKLLRLEKRIGG